MIQAQMYRFSWDMLIVSSAIFISLSVVSASEQRKCHWCGPLAEQVHRSRRALPCDTSQDTNHVTVCDPGYPYCAVVVTSPPYIESRYCVKIYQDECYSIFCNSTKKWRMTCPCHGDLCNGIHTERENLAFRVILPKLVAKTHSSKIKKRTILTSQSLIGSEEYKLQTPKEAIIANDVFNETDNTNVTEESDEQKKNDVVMAIIDNNLTESLIQDPINEVKTVDDDNSIDKIHIELTTKINNVKNKENDLTTYATEAPMMTTAKIRNDKSIINTEVKPSEVLPTAKALQQNVSPVYTMENQDIGQITTESTSITTSVTLSTTSITHTEINKIKPTSSLKKNNAEQHFSHFFIIIVICLNIIIF
ncbi:uncharacterized protein LOC131846639 [Achroia grisella]|uniref:uncharacterized protein LOC131846639 n=1 Tax=Achroia grisella TaxID=688607 RepID=UPI0027D1F169|nr:uncharacterized protein LOC131846639 [Achroia grisella]